MLIRIAAALALVLGATGLLGYLHIMGKGPFASLEMQHLRAMKDRSSAPETVTPMTYDAFVELPHRLSVAEYSGYERRGASAEGYVQRILRAADGDVHIELVPEKPAEGALTTYLTAELTPAFTEGSAPWSYEMIAATLRPNSGTWTPWDGGPRRVRLSGWLLYDFQYDDSLGLWSGQKPARMTGWEIHPVTRIELWSDSAATWVEYAR